MANDHLATPTSLDHYDIEWVDLILEAKRAGISPDEIRSFLAKGNTENNEGKMHKTS